MIGSLYCFSKYLNPHAILYQIENGVLLPYLAGNCPDLTFLSPEFKSVFESLWEKNFFSPSNLSFTSGMWQVSHCSIAATMENTQMN